MLSERLDWLSAAGEVSLRAGLRGVEKETLRVDPYGRLAQTAHPRGCGSALTHPQITTDYSEALLELVTPPLVDNAQTLTLLDEIQSFIYSQIGDEMLWPMSMPCELDGDESIPIAQYGPSNAGMFRTIYRRGLGHRYGRSMQAIAGVHFNYSPPEAFWPLWQAHLADSSSPQDFRSAALMGLVRNYHRHAWLIMYLFGASPAFARSFLPDGNALLQPLDADTWYAPYATTLRMSDIGYQNRSLARLQICTDSVAEYAAGLRDAVTTPEPRYADIGVCVDGEYRQLNANRLQIENEYYSTIRPKPPAGDLRPTAALRQHGVQYVEVRTLDLSPYDAAGMSASQLCFIEVLLLHCLLDDSPCIDANEQEVIAARNLLTARDGRRPDLQLPFNGAEHSVADAFDAMLPALHAIADLLDDGTRQYRDAVDAAHAAAHDPQRTPSALVLGALRDADMRFIDYGLQLARQYRTAALSVPLSSAAAARQNSLAADSLQAAAALEDGAQPSFEAYLEQFMRSA